MADTQVPIGQVKRDISDLVNRVAYGGERIVLTSRGRPKAALVSIEDYEHLTKVLKEGGKVYARRLVVNIENYERPTEKEASSNLAHLQIWLAQTDALVAEILERRGGEEIAIDDLMKREREELEKRNDWVASRH